MHASSIPNQLGRLESIHSLCGWDVWPLVPLLQLLDGLHVLKLRLEKGVSYIWTASPAGLDPAEMALGKVLLSACQSPGRAARDNVLNIACDMRCKQLCTA